MCTKCLGLPQIYILKPRAQCGRKGVDGAMRVEPPDGMRGRDTRMSALCPMRIQQGSVSEAGRAPSPRTPSGTLISGFQPPGLGETAVCSLTPTTPHLRCLSPQPKLSQWLPASVFLKVPTAHYCQSSSWVTLPYGDDVYVKSGY